MSDLSINISASQLQQGQFASIAAPWYVGRIIQALVVGRMADGSIQLRIAGRLWHALTHSQVEKGSILLLEVTSMGAQPEFSILKSVNQKSEGLRGKPGSREILGVVDFINSLSEPHHNKLLGKTKSSLLRTVYPIEELSSPQGLHRAFTQAGNFLERSLLYKRRKTDQPVMLDTKAELFRIRRKLLRQRTAPDNRPQLQVVRTAGPTDQHVCMDLLAQVESLLQVMTERQLASVRAVERGATEWEFELPVSINDSAYPLNIKISRVDTGQYDDLEHVDRWRINLQMELPKYGRVVSDVHVNGNRITVVISAQHSELALVLNQNLEQLRSALRDRNLDATVLLCHHSPDIGADWYQNMSSRLSERV